MRAKVLDDWKDEIEEIYREVEKSGTGGYGDGDDDKGVWREEVRVREFVKSVVEGVMTEGDVGGIDPERDLFEQGCDSYVFPSAFFSIYSANGLV